MLCTHTKWLELPTRTARRMSAIGELIQKKIRFSTEGVQLLIEIRPEANYVTLLYTLAELGFSDSTYAAKNAWMKSKEYTRKHDSYPDQTYVPWSDFESRACLYNSMEYLK